jgi:toxin FitB
MIVLDTNVLSELMRPEPHPGIIRWVAQFPSSSLFTTAVTQSELLYGLELMPEGKRRAILAAGAEEMFGRVLLGRILPFDSDAARLFAVVAAGRRKSGRPMSQPDGQIAAIARSHDATLATRNIRDFENCGIPVVNPWQS